MAPVYASSQNFSDHVEGWTTTDAAALDRLLERAERDIDAYVGPVSVEANGRKFGSPATTNEKGLSDAQRTALMLATVAQAYARYRRGEDSMYDAEYDSVSGPDFNVSGRRSRLSPQAKQELAGTGLVVRSARVA